MEDEIKQQNLNNIIYFDGNFETEEYKASINKDYKYFRDSIDENLKFCSKYDELKEEIIKIKNKDTKLDIIINGKHCENVMNQLRQDNLYIIINSICIFTGNKKHYLPLKNNYREIKLISTNKKIISGFFNPKLSNQGQKPLDYSFTISSISDNNLLGQTYEPRNINPDDFYGPNLENSESTESNTLYG